MMSLQRNPLNSILYGFEELCLKKEVLKAPILPLQRCKLMKLESKLDKKMMIYQLGTTYTDLLDQQTEFVGRGKQGPTKQHVQ